MTGLRQPPPLGVFLDDGGDLAAALGHELGGLSFVYEQLERGADAAAESAARKRRFVMLAVASPAWNQRRLRNGLPAVDQMFLNFQAWTADLLLDPELARRCEPLRFQECECAWCRA